MTKLWHLNFVQGKFCFNNPYFQVEAQTVREQESRYSQSHSDRATSLRLMDLYSCLSRLARMFYFLFIFKPIDKLFLVVVLCEQLKLQAFQTIEKLKREPSDNALLDQRLTKQHLQNKSHFIAVLSKKENLLLQLLFPIEIPYIPYYWHL